MFVFESVVYVFICLYFWLTGGPWQYLQIPYIILSLLGIIFLFLMPESPRFLVAAQRYDDARRVFKWIGAKNGLSKEQVEQRMNHFSFAEGDRVGADGGGGSDASGRR